MKKKWLFLLGLIIQLPSMASITAPLTQAKDLNALALMSGHDLANNSVSNFNLTNKTGAPITVYGIYLYGVASITPGLPCNENTISSSNAVQSQFMAGTIIAPMSFSTGQSVAIGQNYLYNMLYTWIYWRFSSGGVAACSLPGCTWTTDTDPVNWCLQVGVTSPNSAYTSTPYQAKVAPFSWATIADNFEYTYNYDLIPNTNNYVWIGPFTCDDKTLTCVTPSPQSQSFQPS